VRDPAIARGQTSAGLRETSQELAIFFFQKTLSHKTALTGTTIAPKESGSLYELFGVRRPVAALVSRSPFNVECVLSEFRSAPDEGSALKIGGPTPHQTHSGAMARLLRRARIPNHPRPGLWTTRGKSTEPVNYDSSLFPAVSLSCQRRQCCIFSLASVSKIRALSRCQKEDLDEVSKTNQSPSRLHRSR